MLAMLIQCRVLLKLDRFHDVTDSKKYKWPRKVQASKTPATEGKVSFYCFVILPKKRRIFPFLIVTMVLMLCLFPIWPYKVRVVVFYLSLYATIFILAFSFIRFLIYYVFRLIGYEFWILPEIFDNDSFVPYYTLKRIEDSLLAIIVRVLFALATVFYVGVIYFFPESHDGIGEILITSYDDVVDWGKDYIAFNFTKDISNKTLTYEKLLESEEDNMPIEPPKDDDLITLDN